MNDHLFSLMFRLKEHDMVVRRKWEGRYRYK